MSQAGLLDIESTHPQIPTLFVADAGSAIPIANELDIIGGEGIDTTGAGKTLTISGEDATAGATALLANKGIASFDSGDFTVVNGFVSIAGSFGGVQSILTDSGLPAVTPDGTGQVNLVGGTGITVTGNGPGNTAIVNTNLTSIGGTVTITNAIGSINLEAMVGVDQQKIYYVGKHGNDANSGLNIDEAMLTFGAAITAAGLLIPSAVNRFVIKCFDEGIYTENITCASYVDIEATNATLTGTITCADSSDVKFHMQNVATGLVAVAKLGGGTSYSNIDIDIVTLAGNAIGFLGLSGYLNCKWKELYVVDGFGIGDVTSAVAHMHICGGDIYISGNGVGIARANAGTIVGRVDHIEDIGVGATTGILMLDGDIQIDVNHLDCDAAINIDGATTKLNLICNHIEGTQTVTTNAELNLWTQDSASIQHGDATFVSNTAAETRDLTVQNTDDTAASYSAAAVNLIVGGGTTTGDPYTNYLVTGAGTYSIGIDNSDLDQLKITTGATPSAGSTIMRMANSGNVYVELGDFYVQRASIGGIVESISSNTDNSNAASSAGLFAMVGGTSAGDPYTNYLVSGAGTYSVGIDNSDSDKFKINAATTPSGGSDLFTMTSAGVITLANDLDVTEGGTGVSTLTSHGILMGNGAGDIQATAEPSDGQILIGDTAGFPILATITAGTGISVTNGAGSITIATSGGDLIYEEVTDATKQMEVNHCYGANNAAGIDFLLPLTSAKGDVIQIVGIDGIWNIYQNDNQSICYGTDETTVGVGSGLTCDDIGDCITLRCIDTDITWRGTCAWGSFREFDVGDLYAMLPDQQPLDSILFLDNETGGIWGSGRNDSAQLADNSLTNRSSPILIVGNHSFSQISGGAYHSLGLKSDGSCWGWGYNPNGEIGDLTIVDKSSPVAVVGSHSFVQVYASSYSSFGLKENGETWSWGSGTDGALGDYTTTSQSSPVLVVGSHSFIYITGNHYDAPHHAIYGLKSDGSVWSWGDNDNGALGDLTIVDKSSPVAVVGSHSFIEIKGGNQNCLALKADGSCWGWGYNLSGQLGDLTTDNKSSPVAVVGSHSFVHIGSASSSGAGIKAGGNVWTWGANTFGALGDLTTDDKSSPVEIVGSHRFIKVSGGSEFFTAVKFEGTVWAWGYNDYGKFGNQTNTNESSPIQIFGSVL